ncbi:MAG: hypothetical protein Q9171_002269 [Xanthocarpia ochracea]
MNKGVLQVSVPFVIYFNNYNPKQRKNTMWLGCLLCVASPIGGAYAKTPYQLVICLGPLYGIGAGMLFAPSMSFIAEWFDKRKSLAYGFMSGMGGLSGAILPPIFEVCLDRYGHKATLIGMAIAVFILTAFGLFFVTSRVPDDNPPKPKRSDFDFLRKPLFWVLLTATAAQGLAHYMPSLYLPSYAIDMGLLSAQGSLLVSLINLAQAIGQPLQGLLADSRESFYPPMIISTFGSGLETFLIWGFSHNLWSLAIYSFLYGGTAGGYAVLVPRFATGIVGNDKNKEQSLLIFGILMAMRGSAIFASGFIVATQLDESAKVTSGYGAYKWLRVIIYTGSIMIVATLGALGFFIRPTWTFGRKPKETELVGETSEVGMR